MANYAGTAAVFEVRSTATAGNVNGGGFNPANANFLTDGAATVATGNSPVFTSASYNFVAGDVGAWLFIKSGTNWTPGWYQIASVGANAATLSAAIGQGVQIVNNRYTAQTVAGCATVASPTAATWGIDYSQQNAAQFSGSDLTGATTTCTSSSTPFTTAMVGNFICLASGTGVTAGWYEIVSVSGVTATLDRSAGTTFSVVVYKTGGAISLGGSTTGITDLLFWAIGGSTSTSATRIFIKKGAYTSQAVNITTVSGNAAWPVVIEGYNALRGDRPSIASGNQPSLAMGANSFTAGSSNDFYTLAMTGTGSIVWDSGINSRFFYCKCTNIGTVATQDAFSSDGTPASWIGCEAVSYRGIAFNCPVNCFYYGCYAHDSNTGFNTRTGDVLVNCIVCSCVTNAISDGNGSVKIIGCTVYGAENKTSVGINLPWNNDIIMNNIFYGFTTALTRSSVSNSVYTDYNDYFDNTNIVNDVTKVQQGPNDIAVNPSFTSVSQLTGSTATTTAGNHLVQSGATFVASGVTAGRDYLYLISGTGVTAGIYGILSVDSATQITTDIALTANATADKTWQITTGRNFLPTGAV